MDRCLLNSCKDGHWVISQIHRPGRWAKFLDWVKDPELSSDPSLSEEQNQHKRRDFIMTKRYTLNESWAIKRLCQDVSGLSNQLSL